MKGNYDNIAPFYDRLSRLVFRNAIIESQRFLLKYIPPNSSILIVGGGSGQILEEIRLLKTRGLNITYVEESKTMIDLSKRKNIGDTPITFINQSVQQVSFLQFYDVVITPFLLDNFSTTTAQIVFDKIHNCLKPGGSWLFADFHITSNSSIWQKLLLKLMYLFFRVCCNIEGKHLPDFELLFRAKNYQIEASYFFLNGFIRSVVYVKP